jgi:uncharacterized DUF497 family protein
VNSLSVLSDFTQSGKGSQKGEMENGLQNLLKRYIVYTTGGGIFEWDADKSQGNQEKHEISFEQGKGLWLDEDGVEIKIPLYTQEVRYFLIAQYEGKIWTAVFTYRDENIRLISIRRSRDNERKIYEQERNNS